MSEDCKCFLSCELKMVLNGNRVGMIGEFVVSKRIKHYNRMCQVHSE